MLDEILTPAIARALEAIPAPAVYRGPDELDQLLDEWELRGAEVHVAGRSRGGRRIRFAVIGQGLKTFAAWGFPHPDEPIGAEALAALGELLLNGMLDELSGWRFVLMLCADPDQARHNDHWMHGPRDLETFVHGAWRPTHMSIEVDYGFPLEHWPWATNPLHEGCCRSRAECAVRCGGGPCKTLREIPSPLPESEAIAAMLDRYPPVVAASMHGTHTGGDYTFLLHREPSQVLDDLIRIPEAVGRVRHLGEPVDRGHRWRRDAPDLIHEKTLAYFQRVHLERPLGRPVEHDEWFQGQYSAGNYVEAMFPGSQFACPETTQFLHPRFADTSPWLAEERCQVSVEDRKNGKRWRVVRILVDGEWVVAEQYPADGARRQKPVEKLLPQTRAMLAVRALVERRKAIHAADLIWARVAKLDGFEPHPYLDERHFLQVPGAFVHDKSMRLYRTSDEYRGRIPTEAQAACFQWRWPIHGAALLGNLHNFLDAQDTERPQVKKAVKDLERVQKRMLAPVPKELRVEHDPAAAVRSTLARALRLLLARGL